METSTENIQPLRLLIVDDSPTDRALYKRFLRPRAYSFDIAETTNCADAIRYVAEHDVDCIILDYNLPDASGLEFIQNFKDKAHAPYTGILMVTGQGSEETAVEAMKTGATDYISKDRIGEGVLVKAIDDVIEKASLRRQIQQYQEYLEQSNQALSEFSHTVSHDLKAPLRRMIAFCELLEESAGDKLEGESLDYMKRIIGNALRMQRFIDDLLAYSRVLHAHEEKTVVDLNVMVSEIIDDLDVLIKENSAEIEVKSLPRVPAYPTKLRQLILNLISNGIKYHGEAPPRLKVYAEDQPERPNMFVIAIKDNGIGIPADKLQDIFKVFERMHSHDAIEGTGLGLSICEKVIESHNGEIWVESALNKGSTFYFSLPKEEIHVVAGSTTVLNQ